MRTIVRGILQSVVAACLIPLAWGGVFGTVVPIGGHVSDIALDEPRGLLYIANFTATQIDVMSTLTRKLQSVIAVPPQPASLALSPDGHYLVVGHYDSPNAPVVAITVIDRNSGTQKSLGLGVPVLAVAFGGGSQALIVTSKDLELLDPSTQTLHVLQVQGLDSKPLPVPWATSPPKS